MKDSLWRTESWVWPVAWLAVAVGVGAWVWVAAGVDLSYALIVATVGVREVLTGLTQRDPAWRILAWAIGFPAVLWVAGLVLAQLTGWGWTGHSSGAVGVAIAAGTACIAVSARSIVGQRRG